jgi:hypothetical protein
MGLRRGPPILAEQQDLITNDLPQATSSINQPSSHHHHHHHHHHQHQQQLYHHLSAFRKSYQDFVF